MDLAKSTKTLSELLNATKRFDEDERAEMKADHALLTENADIKHDVIDALRHHDIEKFEQLLKNHQSEVDMSTWVCLMDEECHVLEFLTEWEFQSVWHKARLFCYAFEDISTPEKIENIRKIVDIPTELNFDMSEPLTHLARKYESLSFWYNLMRKLRVAERSQETPRAKGVYKDFVNFLYGRMKPGDADVVRLAVALSLREEERAFALARQLERTREWSSCEKKFIGVVSSESLVDSSEVGEIDLCWLALMAANFDVLETFQRMHRKELEKTKLPEGFRFRVHFEFDLFLLYPFCHQYLLTEVPQRMEDRGFLDARKIEIEFAKIFAAVARGASEMLRNMLENLDVDDNMDMLSSTMLNFRCKTLGYDSADICQDIRGKRSQFSSKSLYVVALENENLEALELLVKHNVLPYHPGMFRSSMTDEFDWFVPHCFTFYHFVKRDAKVFDILLKGKVRQHVAPLVLLYAAHELDLKFIQMMKRKCGTSVLSDRPQDCYPAYQLALTHAKCEDMSMVLSLLKGDDMLPQMGKQVNVKLDPVALCKLTDAEVIELLDGYDWTQKSAKEESLLVKAVDCNVSFARFLLIKQKVQDNYPGGVMQAIEMASLFDAAINHEDPNFLGQFISDEDIASTAHRLSEGFKSTFPVAIVESFLAASETEPSRLSLHFKELMAILCDDVLFELNLEKFARIVVADRLQPKSSIFKELATKVLNWCESNRDVWMISVVNWILRDVQLLNDIKNDHGASTLTVVHHKHRSGRNVRQSDGWTDIVDEKTTYRKEELMDAKLSICDLVKSQSETLFKAQNSIGMNVLMYTADHFYPDIGITLFQHLLATGMFDVNATAKVRDLATKFDLQHLAGTSFSARKHRNTVLMNNELIRGKRVLVKEENTGEYAEPLASFPGQAKYVSKEAAALRDPAGTISRIMVTAKKPVKQAKDPVLISDKLEFVVEENVHGRQVHDPMEQKDCSSHEPEDAISVHFDQESSTASHRQERPPPEGLEDATKLTLHEKVNKMQLKTLTGITPEHFDSQSLVTDEESSGFRTKKNKYKFAADTSTKGFTTDSSVAELLSPNYCIGTNVLLLSIKANQRYMVEYLLTSTNVDVYHKDASQCSALSLIIKNFKNSSDLVKLALAKMDKKTMKKDKDADGKTARMIAEELGLDNVVNVLDNFDFDRDKPSLEATDGRLELDGFSFAKKGEMNKKGEQRWKCVRCPVTIRTNELPQGRLKLLGKHNQALHKHENERLT